MGWGVGGGGLRQVASSSRLCALPLPGDGSAPCHVLTFRPSCSPLPRVCPRLPSPRRWLQDQLPPEARACCYFFNTFFFKKLMETEGEGGRRRRAWGERWMQPHCPALAPMFSPAPPLPLPQPTGGALTPELEAWAADKGLKGAKLQALRNHQKVKKWTKVGGLGGEAGSVGQ